MGCVKLIFFMLYVFLFQFVFSSSLPHLCPEDQALSLLQFKNMFTINPNAFDYCYDISTGQEIQSYPRTLLWNKSTDCCSWDGVHCDETTGQVIELHLGCSQLQGKQFDTFENTSYQGNDGLRGLPLSKHCGGDDQETIPAELDQEEEDSPMISWQAVLMGYGCGLIIGIVRNIHNVVNSISSMVFEDGFKIETQNYCENEKAQEKILVCIYTSRIRVYRVSEDADKSLHLS